MVKSSSGSSIGRHSKVTGQSLMLQSTVQKFPSGVGTQKPPKHWASSRQGWQSWV